MGINVKVKWNFTVNGKKYGSLEEMPEDIRKAYEKTLVASPDGGLSISKTSRIVFNGQEYESVDAMPEDVRSLYENIMNTVRSGKKGQSGLSERILSSGGYSQKPNRPDVVKMGEPIEPESSFFTSRSFSIAVLLLLALLIGFYLLSRKP